ncbi:putative competence-damage inducible protein [subsurface metagenome]
MLCRGVPAEMKEMFEEQVLPKLTPTSSCRKTGVGDQVIVTRKLKCFGTGESAVAELIGDVMKRGRNPLINCTAKHGVITLHIIATAKDKSTAERMAEEDEKMLRRCLGELVYGVGEQTLAEVVGQKLARQKKTIAVAESCTGGALAKLITDVEGASRYFTHGWVTYSNQAKIKELGVSADLIERYGAVSEQISEAMAVGARKKAKTDFAIGITGIAGPPRLLVADKRGGRSEQKPVGLVYISVDADKHSETKRFIFRDDIGLQTCGNDTAGVSGNRQLIRLRAALTGLNMLRLQL